jgi:hypothetical protein
MAGELCALLVTIILISIEVSASGERGADRERVRQRFLARQRAWTERKDLYNLLRVPTPLRVSALDTNAPLNRLSKLATLRESEGVGKVPVKVVKIAAKEASATTLRPWSFDTIEFGSVDAVVKSRLDAVWAVATGHAPAVIVRGFLSADECDEIMSKTPGIELGSYGFAGASAHQHATTGGNDLNSYFNTHMPRTRKMWKEVFGVSTGKPTAIERLQSVVSLLSGGNKRCQTATQSTSQEYNPVVIRWHHPGSMFYTHFDSVHAHLFDELKQQCHIKTNPEPSNLKQVPMYRYRRLMSSIVMLKTPKPNASSVDSTYHDLSYFDILRWNCTTIRKLDGATHHQIGANVPQIDKMLGSYTKSTPKLNQGDLIIFNSNKIHDVSPVVGIQARVTRGSFISYDEDLDSMLMWS